jgi:hypothetical protein
LAWHRFKASALTGERLLRHEGSRPGQVSPGECKGERLSEKEFGL